MWLLLGRAALIALTGGVLGFASNAWRKDGVPLTAFAPPTTCQAPVAAAKGHVEVLAPAAAVRACGDPAVLVADARSGDRFERGHVARAVHLPCGATSDTAERALALAAGKRTIVVYGDTTEEARPVAEELRSRLADPAVKVIVIDGGFPAWNAAGLACAAGPCPDCKEHAER